MNAVAALKASPLFKGFTDTGLQIIAGIATERAFPKGVPIFVENMMADALFVLGEGTVRLTSKSKAGEEVAVGELGPGDYLGELSLIQQGQRMCTATATSAVVAYEIRHADFQKLLATKPQACLKLLMGIVSLFGQKVVDNKDAFKAMLSNV
ncbi:MAG: cyclic nucleotide-binding domain-containing protein [Myxococcales bacterium]|nr:cyclic nucleotide-binding domain-containing protein [Myxococcales bacterium]